MAAGDVRVGDVGVILEVQFVDTSAVAVDISTGTTLQIRITRPNGITLTKTATFSAAGVDGKIRYTSVAADFNVAGTYQIQGRAVWATGANDKSTALGTLVCEAAPV